LFNSIFEALFVRAEFRQRQYLKYINYRSLLSYLCLVLTRFELELETLMEIGTDCIGSCKSNCHTITAATAGGEGQICFDVVAYVLYKRNYELQYLNKHRIKLKYDLKIKYLVVKYATIDGLLCIIYTKFMKGQTSVT
jgi:hypothetical protein